MKQYEHGLIYTLIIYATEAEKYFPTQEDRDNGMNGGEVDVVLQRLKDLSQDHKSGTFKLHLKNHIFLFPCCIPCSLSIV